MSLEAITTVELGEIPSNWLTAEKAKEKAVNIKNTHFKECMDEVMAKINLAAEKGCTNTAIHIDPKIFTEEIFDKAVDLLESLGYKLIANVQKTYIYPSW